MTNAVKPEVHIEEITMIKKISSKPSEEDVLTSEGPEGETNATDNAMLVIDGLSYRLMRQKTADTQEVRVKKYYFPSSLTGEEVDEKWTFIDKENNSKSAKKTDFQLTCSLCQNLSGGREYSCVSCEAPCRKCFPHPVTQASTSTEDLESYLDSFSRKVKILPKTKTVATDTCDLDRHFDYYHLEIKPRLLQKTVSTDCGDLVARKMSKRLVTVAVDTGDLSEVHEKTAEYPGKNTFADVMDSGTERGMQKTERLIVSPDCECHKSRTSKDEMRMKSEHDIEREITPSKPENVLTMIFNEFSSDSESDLDLLTSSKVTRSKVVAKSHNLSLLGFKINDQLLFKCPICEKIMEKKYLGILHLENHVEKDEYKCLGCGIKLATVALLMAHVKSAHTGEKHEKAVNHFGDKNVKCRICEKKFTSKSKMLSHKRFHKQTDKIFECILCGSSKGSPPKFPSYKALLVHERCKHGSIKSPKHLKMDKKPRFKREFICLFCGKEFKSNKALNDHSPVHTGEKNYPCEICNKSYTTSANLQIHKRTHTGVKSFKCTACDKAFHKKDSLKVHFRKHSGERPFECDLCPMKFDRNYILKNHRLRHFSEKTHICPVCGKAFTTHGGLNNHEKSHKRDPDSKKPRKPAVKPTLDAENAVICDVCGKVYSTRSNLRIHKFVHLGVKPFQCPVCQQSYAKKDSMLTHMRKHTDERPFACETCGMTFYRNHTLKTHRLRHTGERPHKCTMCGKSFTQSSSLAYHIKHHNKKDVNERALALQDGQKPQRKKRVDGSCSSGRTTTGKGDTPVNNNVHLPCEERDFKDSVPGKKSSDVSKDSETVNQPGKESMLLKGGHFMVPVEDKEILILDSAMEMESPKEMDFFTFEKEVAADSSLGNRLSYYVAKSQMVSLPKELPKQRKSLKRDGEENEQDGENLIVSKNSYITKDGNLITADREILFKAVKDDFSTAVHQVSGGKAQNVLSVDGEIPTFITEGNGEAMTFTAMTLQNVSAENIPVICIESHNTEERKALFRGSKSKQSPGIVKRVSEKGIVKGCQIIKDSRMGSRIQVISPRSVHIQMPITSNSDIQGVLMQGIPAIPGGFYTNIESEQV